jgi:hypothetical protein
MKNEQQEKRKVEIQDRHREINKEFVWKVAAYSYCNFRQGRKPQRLDHKALQGHLLQNPL